MSLYETCNVPLNFDLDKSKRKNYVCEHENLAEPKTVEDRYKIGNRTDIVERTTAVKCKDCKETIRSVKLTFEPSVPEKISPRY